MSKSLVNIEPDNDIYMRINSRRETLSTCQRINGITSDLCDEINVIRKQNPSLDKKIKSFEVTNPDLFEYIRYLEWIRYGIWCTSCQTEKMIDAQKQHDEADQEYTDLVEKLALLKSSQNELVNELQQLSPKIPVDTDFEVEGITNSDEESSDEHLNSGYLSDPPEIVEYIEDKNQSLNADRINKLTVEVKSMYDELNQFKKIRDRVREIICELESINTSCTPRVHIDSNTNTSQDKTSENATTGDTTTINTGMSITSSDLLECI